MSFFQNFLSYTRLTGLARANRFYVDFQPPPSVGPEPILSLLCEEATFPGKRIDTRTLRINALSEQRAHTGDYLGKEVSFRFLVDNPWEPRRILEDWMNLAIDPVFSTDESREVGYYEEYIGSIIISALTPMLDEKTFNVKYDSKNSLARAEKETFKMQFFEVWPTAISSQSAGSTIEGYHRLSATFAFKWWESSRNII